MRLHVITVREKNSSPSPVFDGAQRYLESYGIQANYFEKKGKIAESILAASEEHGCDLILMGGYGSSPVKEVILGSSIDQVLRESIYPILISR